MFRPDLIGKLLTAPSAHEDEAIVVQQHDADTGAVVS
jgi:hypothetical protein